VTEHYVHSLDAVLIAEADRVAAQIDKWMGGEITGEIVDLPERIVSAALAQAGGHSSVIVSLPSQRG
jgi:hypothetical protein